MTEIILSNQSLSASHFKQQTGLGTDNLSSLSASKPKIIRAYTPYAIDSRPTSSARSSSSSHSGMDSSGSLFTPGVNRSTMADLSDPNVCRTVTDLSLCYGGDNVMALGRCHVVNSWPHWSIDQCLWG